MSAPVRVVIADDSPLCLAAIREALDDGGGFTIVGEAHDGEEAIAAVRATHPQVVVMDVHMPGSSGLDAVERIMAVEPTPILVLTGDPGARTGRLAYEALRRGALELLPKEDIARPGADRARLRDTVRFLATVPVVRHLSPRARRAASAGPRGPATLVALVASTGGPAALAQIFAKLPGDLPAAVLLVQHLAPRFVDGFARWLDRAGALEVRLAADGARPRQGQALVAPDERSMTIEGGRVRLGPPHPRPGDVLLASVASEIGARAVGAVMTGMGADGAEGLLALRRAGGTTLVQDASSSAVYGMPAAALRLEPAHAQLAPDAIADALIALTRPRVSP